MKQLLVDHQGQIQNTDIENKERSKIPRPDHWRKTDNNSQGKARQKNKAEKKTSPKASHTMEQGPQRRDK